MKAIIFFQLACLTTAYRWVAEAFNMIWRGRTAVGAQCGQLKRSVSSALMVFPAGIFDKIWGKDSEIRPAGQKTTNYFGLSFFKGLGLLGNVSEIIAAHSPSQAVQPTIEEVQDFIASLHAAKSPPTAPQSKAPPNVGKVNRNCNLIVGFEDLDLPVFTARTSNNVKVSPRPRPSAGRPRRLLSSPRTIDNMLAD